MKSTVLVRPNLKLFLLAAVLIAAGHDLLFDGPVPAFGRSLPTNLNQISDADLAKLVEAAEAKMDPELYMKASYAFEKRGDAKKALLYLRKAEKCEAAQN
jgi:hypothetical protein